MKDFTEDEQYYEPSKTHYSLDFQKREKNSKNKRSQLQSSLNRALSAKTLLYNNYIPKLRPVKSHLNPSFMHLGGNNEDFNPKKYKENILKNKNDINVVVEEDYEKSANSGDERYSHNNLKSNKILSFSSNDEKDIIKNDLITNIDDINEFEDDININFKNIKNMKSIKNKINHIRNLVIKIKEKIPNQKYIDDTDIIPNTPYKDYINHNFSFDWEENYLDYDIGFSEKKKSKSIYEGKNKNKKRPPILGFLQMNENSANTTFSSALSEL